MTAPAPPGPRRRAVLAAGFGGAGLARAAGGAVGAGIGLVAGGCERRSARDGPRYAGGWVGIAHERGHLLRTKSGTPPAPATTRRVGALVVGAGIAGLGAARTFAATGEDDVHLLELEDTAGGNSRGHAMGGMRCPLGAHYLPAPDAAAVEVVELLEALGVRKPGARGGAVYDERVLCASPQERVFVGGGWREGLLPPVEALPEAERAATRADYLRFAALVAEAGRAGAFVIPTARSRVGAAEAALDRVTFAAWLDARGLVAPALRWYLDYCCRDDYGAGSRQVSAWAGLHYFCSRHGFRAPVEGGTGPDHDLGTDAVEGVLTWPEGNAWLAERLAAPFQGERLHVGRVVTAVAEARDAVSVDAWNVAAQRVERWIARRVVLALPLFVAARLVQAPPPALLDAAARLPHAPWLVANLQLDSPLDDRPGAPPSWDNVRYGGASLGYVDAMHQSTRSFAGPTVLTSYWALGGDDAAALAAARRALLEADWPAAAARVVADLAVLHPDLERRLVRVDLTRYGHAMAVPVPGVRTSPALAALAGPQRRLHYAHADLSGYSVFEEALYHGVRAARQAGAALAG